MTVENDFLPYATGGGANVLTQSAYAALPALGTGAELGLASSAFANKAWRQSSIIAAVVAQLIVQQTGQPAIDDGTTATLLANLTSAVTTGFPSSFSATAASGGIVPPTPNGGAFIQVNGVNTTQTLNNASWTSGQTVGFYAASACTIALTGGAQFAGGYQTGQTSVVMPAGTWLCLIFNGGNWIIFSASPNLFVQPSLLAIPGYRFNSDGSIEQWGNASIATGNGDVVTFPIPFPNQILNIQVTDWGNGCQRPGWALNGGSLSTFLAYAIQTNGSFVNMKYGWRAIGW